MWSLGKSNLHILENLKAKHAKVSTFGDGCKEFLFWPCTSAFCANQQGSCQCNHQGCNSNICDFCSLRLFKDESRFRALSKNGLGEIRRALLLKRPSYLDSVKACCGIAELIVDCTCTGSLLQWFPELTFDKPDPLWICEDDRICTALIECFDFCQVDDRVCCALAEQIVLWQHVACKSSPCIVRYDLEALGTGYFTIRNDYSNALRRHGAALLPISQSSIFEMLAKLISRLLQKRHECFATCSTSAACASLIIPSRPFGYDQV